VLVVAAAAVAGARLGLRPVSDNSTLVHLRTGLQLLTTGHVPTADPYSFTAPGHPWVVQSWLASLLYGASYRVAGHAFIALQGAVMGATAAVIALAARSTTAWRSALAATIAIAASAPGWSPRPLMFELLCLALVVLVVERRASPWWLVPIVWVWANTHGSWPIGLAWLVARAVGEAIDWRQWPRMPVRYIGAFAAGLVVAMANPLTWHVVMFPFTAWAKRGVLQGVVEWRSPNFQTGNSFVALVFIAIALVVLLRARLPWADTLPVIGFLALGLFAERNLAPFGVVLAPALGRALGMWPVGPWAARAERAGRAFVWRAGALAGIAAVLGLLLVRSLGQPVLNLTEYPVHAVDYLAATGRLAPQHHIAEVDVVGCYLIWRAGPATKVFIDDRYDMYPPAVVAAASALSAAQGGERVVLDRYHVDTVVWASSEALPGALLDEGWHRVYDDGHWSVLERS
jgi:hypothetical protein